MATVRDILVRLLGDGAHLEKTLSTAARNIDATGRRLSSSGKTLSASITAPITAAALGIFALAQQAAGYADQIDKATFRTGVSASSLQEYVFAADQAGVSADILFNSLQQLTLRASEAAQGNKAYTDTFRELGVAVKDANGQVRSTEELLPEIAEALSRVENESDRVRIIFGLMGRNGAILLPLLTQGAAGLAEFRDRARELGLVLSEREIADLVAYGDQISELKSQFAGLGREVAVGFLPVIQEQLIPFIKDAVLPRIRDWTRVLRGLDVEGVKVIATTAGFLALLGPLVLGVGQLFGVIAAVTRILAVMGAGAATLGGLLVPGGIVLAGLGFLARHLFNVQLDAAKAAIAVAGMRGEIFALSSEARQARWAETFAKFRDEAIPALAEAQERVDRLRRVAEQPFDFGLGASGLGRTMSAEVVQAQQDLEAAQRVVRDLSVELNALNDAERSAAERAADLDRVLGDLGLGLEDSGKKVRTVADILKDLDDDLKAAGELARLSRDFDENALAISALEQALRELVSTEGAAEEQLQAVAGALRGRRAEAARLAKEQEAKAKAVADALREEQEELATINSLLAAAITPAERFVDIQTLMTRALAEGSVTWEEFSSAMGVALDQLQRSESTAEETGRSWQEEWADVVVSAAGNVQLSFRSMAQGIIAQIALVTARLLVMRALMAVLLPFAGSGGVLGALFATVSAPFGGGRASGGPVSVGRAYRIGERGPEWFIPGASGEIMPALAAGGGSDGAATAAEVLSMVGPPPGPLSPELAATHDWYRRLISASMRDHRSRGGRVPGES